MKRIIALALLTLACRARVDAGAQAKTAVHQIAAAANDWRQAHEGRCPAKLDELVAAKQVQSAKDPWDNAYVLTCPGNYDLKGGADVSSPGPDHELGNHDDVNSWE